MLKHELDPLTHSGRSAVGYVDIPFSRPEVKLWQPPVKPEPPTGEQTIVKLPRGRASHSSHPRVA